MAKYKMTTRRKLAIASWDGPREPNIYGKLTLDVGPALAYMDELRQTTGEKITITHLVGRACALALAAAPTLNGRISLGRFVPFETVDVAFLVALEDGRDLAKAKVTDADKKDVVAIARELRARAEKLRAGADKEFEQSKNLVKLMPVWLLKRFVRFIGWLTGSLGFGGFGLEKFPFGSCIVTSVGMFGLDEGFVPPTPFARVPVYVLVGAVRDRPAAVDGQVVVRPEVTITATIDHRFIDGFQGGTLAKVVREFFENPRGFDNRSGGSPPQLPAAEAR